MAQRSTSVTRKPRVRKVVQQELLPVELPHEVTEEPTDTDIAEHPQQQLFICDISDLALKDTTAQLEHPVYTLTKKPVKKTITYENNGAHIELKPGPDGLPTIYDKDIIIYIVSQMVTRMQRENLKPSKKLRINAHQLLKFTRRGTGGSSYKALETGLDRLQQTQIKTNIQSGGNKVIDRFSMIDRATSKYTHDDPEQGRLTHVDITLSDWLYDAIEAIDVLTLAPTYFEIKKPIHRRVYEIARKHCGAQESWKVGLPVLFKKTGTTGNASTFKFAIKKLVKENKLPDYLVSMERKVDKKTGDVVDMVVFTNRKTMPNAAGKPRKKRFHLSDAELNPQTIEHAKSVLGPQHDVYAVLSDFRAMLKRGNIDVWSMDAQFTMHVSEFKKKPRRSKSGAT